MIQAYNFLASWQLFPEKSVYETGERPINGFYKLSAKNNSNQISVSHNWLTLQQESFEAIYCVAADGALHPFEDNTLADEAQVNFTDTINFEINFYRNKEICLQVIHHILPNGFLKITQQGFKEDDSAFTNIEIYHKQMSVLPYAASVGGALVKPTKEGVIKHKALAAMEEQTDMQLAQIRRQIELLATQAREIQSRKELSMMIYEAKLSFKPNIGQTYFLYLKNDNSFVLSLISPKEWGGGNGPFKKFEAAVSLLADYTWVEIQL